MQIPIYRSTEQPDVAPTEGQLSNGQVVLHPLGGNLLAGNLLDMVPHVARRIAEDDLVGAVGADAA